MQRLPLIVHAVEQSRKCQALQGWTQANFHFRDCEEDEAVMASVCTGKPSHADFFVTQQTFAHRPIASWRFDAGDGSVPVTYYLHDCATVH